MQLLFEGGQGIMDFKVTERHIEALYAAQRMFEKQLETTKERYAEFKGRTDKEGIVIAESYVYLIERDEKHLKALYELIREHKRELYTARYLK